MNGKWINGHVGGREKKDGRERRIQIYCLI